MGIEPRFLAREASVLTARRWGHDGNSSSKPNFFNKIANRQKGVCNIDGRLRELFYCGYKRLYFLETNLFLKKVS